jgi:SAM-dependent methyltransferase
VRQADIFLESEGDAWYERNRARLGQRDPVSEIIEELGIAPDNVLEVGCANGWRLAKLRDKYNCKVLGIDPSMDAIREGMVPIFRATSDNLPRPVGGQFDLIIYGFCLYLADPVDWLRIAAEADTVLAPGGHLIVHDFADVLGTYARRYKHHDNILSYHFDFADLWLAHPLYSLVRRVIDGDEMITMMRKNRVDTFEVRT